MHKSVETALMVSEKLGVEEISGTHISKIGSGHGEVTSSSGSSC